MPKNFNPHLQAAVLEVVENQLVEQQAVAVFINKKNTERHTLCAQFRRSGRAERNPTQLQLASMILTRNHTIPGSAAKKVLVVSVETLRAA